MISKQEVEHIARLARLELTEAEVEKMQKELANILEYVEVLKGVDVSKVESTSHPVRLENVMREDKIGTQAPDTAESIKDQFPDREGDYLRVKGVL